MGGTAPGEAKSGGDKLWEDNWDDDDIEDDFSVQLRSVCQSLVLLTLCSDRCMVLVTVRNELAKKKGNGGGTEPMQH